MHELVMDPNRLRELLELVRCGTVSTDEAVQQLARLPFEDLGIARVDHHRHLRLGIPEVVFGESKTAEQIVTIAAKILEHHGRVLITRVDEPKSRLVCAAMPDLSYDPTARLLSAVKSSQPVREIPPVAIVAAGTSDLPVAEEAAATLLFSGIPCDRIYDVGVAGIHRLLDALPRLSGAPAIIVVAGMEGALPSVVGGLVSAPVVAVPTSVGYGAALSGFTALFGMLTSCASGITVVNIDNGFGAAMAVLRMVRHQVEPA
ncbi:MAG: nickel pincer cofactor biosynthesis protein LarB [Myxococcales bacterium]